MAIGRISGPMLKSNLLRQGVDLSIENDLLYFDVNNGRIGLNKSVPAVDLDISGIVQFNNNLRISGTTVSSENANGNISVNLNGTGTLNVSNLTSGRVVFVGANGSLIDSANLTFDGTNLFVDGDTVFSAASLGNLEISGNTISSTNTNGNIVLDPNGVGTVNISTLTEGRVVFVGADGSLIDSANLTFDGTNLLVAGDTVLDAASLGNLSIVGNTISSTNTNGNIVLDPNGIGDVIVESADANRVFYSGTNRELTTSNSLQYDGSVFSIGNISVSGSSISSAEVDSNFTISVNGTGSLIVDANSSIQIPSGTTVERPTTGNAGDFRFNTDTSNIEYYNGSKWEILTPLNTISGIETFNGDSSTTVFTLNNPTSTAAAIVTLNGVVQSAGNAYSISGTTLTFTEAPKFGDAIEVRYQTESFTPGSIILDNNSSVSIDDDNSRVVTKINNSNVIVTNTSETIFSGSILGTGSLASIGTSVPSSSSDTGIKGEIAYDSSYVYICVATDTWIRAGIENSF